MNKEVCGMANKKDGTKKIVITYEDEEIIARFDKKSAKETGIMIKQAGEEPIATVEAMVRGAFLCEHPYMSKRKALGIYNDLENKDEFFDLIVGMYKMAVEDATLGKEGKQSWNISE